MCQTVCHRSGCVTYLFCVQVCQTVSEDRLCDLPVCSVYRCVCQTVCHRTGCMTYLFVLCTGVCVIGQVV